MPKTPSLLGLFTILLVAALLVSACAAFEDPSQRATENAQNTALWTMVYGVQTEMPTMEALALTADAAVFFSTQVGELNRQNDSLRATNQSLLSGNRPVGTTPFVQPTAIGGGQSSGVFPTPTPGVAGSTSLPDASVGTDNQGGVVGNTRFSQTVTSAAIDDDGCASGITNSFASSATAIYFVTLALNVEPGISFSLRVTQNGSEIASDPNFWTPDQTYDQTCIWYNIDRTTMDFFTGTYTAEFLANGTVAATATFVISGDTGQNTDNSLGESSS